MQPVFFATPAEYDARLRAHPDAAAFWDATPPSYRKPVAFWIASAKRPETRDTAGDTRHLHWLQNALGDRPRGRRPRPAPTRRRIASASVSPDFRSTYEMARPCFSR